MTIIRCVRPNRPFGEARPAARSETIRNNK
jgi:hypothetical protein